MKDYKKMCAECNEKHKDYHPIRYALGKCEICGRYLGVAEVQYYPEVVADIDSLFGNLKTKK